MPDAAGVQEGNITAVRCAVVYITVFVNKLICATAFCFGVKNERN